MPFCFACGKSITFDEHFLSKTGKFIPLTKSTHRPHRCKAKPFNKQTRRRWWYEQQRKAEQQRYEQQQRQQERESYHFNFQEELKQKNYYDILQVKKGCTEKELLSAFRQKMLEYHPDRNHSPDAHEKTIQIIDAYENIKLLI